MMAIEPITREEMLLSAIADGSGSDMKPITREEMFLHSIANGSETELEPITRKEMFLDKILKNGVGGGGSGGGSCDDVRYVTFMSEDGTVELGKKAVATGDDCADPIARGIFPTPTKESTVQYNYTFYGWATKPNGAADSNWNKAVTEDRTVYANFIASVRYYTVSFYDGDTLLTTKSVAYGGTATYSPPAKDGYFFDKWEPVPENITGDMDCYAQWKLDVDFATASWAEIAAICDAGEAAKYFALGDTKEISYTHEGAAYTATVEIVAFDFDDKADGSGKAGITVCTTDTTPWTTIKHDSMTSPACQWPNCKARTLINTTIYNTFEAELKNVIKPVTKITTGYDGSKAATFSTTDNVWMPSLCEAYGRSITNYGLITETGSKFPNYTRKKTRNYFLRTGNSSHNSSFTGIIRTDGAIMSSSGQAAMSVVFGFCI